MRAAFQRWILSRLWLTLVVDLVITGYAGMAAYVVFKTCEHRLSNWLGDQHS